MKKFLAVTLAGALAAGIATLAVAQDKTYRFVMVSHIGSNDPNMKWLTLSLEEFEKKYPDVETEYLSTNEYSIQKHVQLIEQALATNPDGLAVPIASKEAMEPVLRKAIEQGIPVVAFNIPDDRPEGERIPYLTYVGGDEYKTGLELGRYALAQAKAGAIPQPTKVMCAVHDSAHQGLKARCQGMSDAMKEINVEVEELFIGAEPAKARNSMQAYLTRNDDVNVIFTVASWSAPWAWGVADEMGLGPDADDKGMTIITVDASPVALVGIKEGKVLATNSQGFWLQGYIPMEWLYWNHKLGYRPQGDILTGPIVVTRDKIDHWEKLVRTVFGDEDYDKQNTW